MPSHPDADALMRAVLDGLHDAVSRLVLADWLEETGTPSNTAWAHYIRQLNGYARPSREATEAIAGEIRARLTLNTRFFLTHREQLLKILPPENICVRLGGFRPPPTVAEFVPESVSRENKVLALELLPDTLIVASARARCPDLREKLSFILNRKIVLVGAEPEDIDEAIRRVYGSGHHLESVDSIHFEFPDVEQVWDENFSTFFGPHEVEDNFTRLANLIVREALTRNAGAVQIRPTAGGALATYLIGGTWVDVDVIPLQLLSPLADRLRVMGNLDPDGRRGRVEWGLIRFPFRDRNYVFLLEITETAAGPDVLIQLHEPAV